MDKTQRRALGACLLAMLLCACATGQAQPVNDASRHPTDAYEQPGASEQPSASEQPTASGQHGASDRQPLVILYMSDTQADPGTGDYTGFGELLANALAVAAAGAGKPDLLLLGGDTVNDGADESEWRDFRQASAASLEGIPIAAAAGNHDSAALLASQFDWPAAPPERPGQGYFYSLDKDNAHIIVLDSNIMGAANAADVAWLEADLQSVAASAADWRIAVSHHPFWPVADIPKDNARAETIREGFLPLLEYYRVDLLLVGHQHVYARSLPMAGGATARQGGLVQVMAASGGKDSYTPHGQPYLALTAEAPNYVLLSVAANEISAAAYGADGSAIDVFTLRKDALASPRSN